MNLKWNYLKILFRKKQFSKKIGLEEAKEKKLITEEEFLRLKEHRANKELENYLEKNKKSNKKLKRRK